MKPRIFFDRECGWWRFQPAGLPAVGHAFPSQPAALEFCARYYETARLFDPARDSAPMARRPLSWLRWGQ